MIYSAFDCYFGNHWNESLCSDRHRKLLEKWTKNFIVLARLVKFLPQFLLVLKTTANFDKFGNICFILDIGSYGTKTATQ